VNKYVLSFLFLLMATSVLGQKKSKVNLTYSTETEVNNINGKRIIKVRNGIFKQDYSTLTSDSALFYPDLNVVDAFGHVVINQGDTLHIYSDKLNYNGNSKLAVLTDNVKMVEKDAVLTTNNFNYNTATRIGIYTNGGKLVNKDNTLVSQNGYYFAKTRDAYFRYNVLLTTPDAVIKADTLRYNSGTRIAYFLGPTTITGKDKDVLYTENGRYETISEQAFFGKKNLYTQDTKSLKGDSLFYDRLKGYGRAVKNVTFADTKDKVSILGGLGEYFKVTERAVITDKPYTIFITQDSSKKDTTKKIIAPTKAGATTQIKGVPNTMPVNLTLQGVTDSVMKKLPAGAKQITASSQLTLQGITDSVLKKLPLGTAQKAANNKLTLQSITDSVMKNIPAGTKANLPNSKRVLKAVTDSINKKAPALTAKAKAAAGKATTGTKTIPAPKPPAKVISDNIKPAANVKQDTLFLGADTIETQMVTYKAFKDLRLKRYLAGIRDTSIKIAPSIVYKTVPKHLDITAPKWFFDTTYLHRDFFGKPKPKVVKAVPKETKPVVKLTAADSLRLQRKTDSLELIASHGLRDTSRIRIMFAYHNAKIFKSDLQAKADSMFYSSSDSTIRCFVKPIIWTQGSQLTGDTITMQMKNKKLDNMDLFPTGFIVNVEKTDSLHFNQAGGKRIHGNFKDNKLSSMYISGNAETIYFNRDSTTHDITEMVRTVSGRLTAQFKNGELTIAGFYQNPEQRVIPMSKVTEDEKILKAFIWKPKERPTSKYDIIASNKKPAPKKAGSAAKAPPGKGTAAGKNATKGKALIKKPADTKLVTDSLGKPIIKMLRDSTLKDSSTVKPPAVKKDSTATSKPAAKDTSAVKKNK
jgi:lipopolysaccharide export system protein LptA